ncbi:MAG: histidine phosphatase family protein [Streptosporangiales bacterium]|nr:histidine phosphatase family protein [Streptosporangiales bacterium]
MTIRLTLVTPAPGRSLRQARIDDDRPLDEDGRRRAHEAGSGLPRAGRYLTAPSRRCRETAVAVGVDACVEEELRDIDLGAWRGRTLEELAATDPDALAAWTTDPSAASHGGESVLRFCRRIAAWLDHLPDDTSGALAIVAITEPATARAAVVHALGAPPQGFWRIDIPPLASVRLTGRAGRWNLRLG